MSSPHHAADVKTRSRSRQAFAFARGALRAELDQIRRRPFSMPSGWLVLALTAVTTIAILNAAEQSAHGLGRLPVALVYVLAPLAGLVVSIGLMALGELVEGLRFITARHAYLLRTASGVGGAYIREHGGRLTLWTVWAWPRRTGLGAQVLQQACHDVDQTQAPLWLVAANRNLVLYYQRFGFRRVRRVLLGHLMQRPPAAPGAGRSVQPADAPVTASPPPPASGLIDRAGGSALG